MPRGPRLDAEEARSAQVPGPRLPLESLVTRVCYQLGVPVDALAGGSRQAPVRRARQGIARLWIGALRQPGRALAVVLGVAPQSVYRAAARGAERGEWIRVLDK